MEEGRWNRAEGVGFVLFGLGLGECKTEVKRASTVKVKESFRGALTNSSSVEQGMQALTLASKQRSYGYAQIHI